MHFLRRIVKILLNLLKKDNEFIKVRFCMTGRDTIFKFIIYEASDHCPHEFLLYAK